jgi:diaminopimelate decarboxylase
VNPNVDAKTHPHISTGLYNNKFGVLIDDAVRLYQLAASQSHLEVVGVDCHIGSQLTDIKPFTDAFKLVIDLVDDLKSAGIVLKHIDIGGGVGVGYKPDQALISLPDYFAVVSAAIGDRTLDVICEPGRSIIAETGLLLTSVQFLKHTPVKHFAIVSAAMNDLIRPALYDSYHEILPVSTNVDTERIQYEWDIVGPVCESADFLGKGRSLALKPGDRLAVMTAGAYGMCMASNYNSRPFLAEYLISGQSVEVIRKRQTNEDMWALERIPASLSSA